MKEENTNGHKMTEVLEVASEAGHIMLENGAEIARVEETMERISRHYGIEKRKSFVLSNGIFTTGSAKEGDSETERYANIEFIPIRGTQMEKIVETNRLSREIEQGRYTLEEARQRLDTIRKMPPKPVYEQVFGSAIGSASFCAIFGGSLLDCAAAFIVGIVLWLSVLYVTSSLSKILANIINGGLVAALSFLFCEIGFGNSLGNIIVGALIPLIPGVAFTNGIRDLTNEDYLAGVVRMLDALVVFLGMAIGACIVFVIQGHISGGVVMLRGALTDPATAVVPIQAASGFLGTIAFAILFGAPRNEYLSTGIVGALSWTGYFLMVKYSPLTTIEATFITSLITVILARETAVIRKCPITVFLICGLCPLIPGGGIFWMTYFLISKQYQSAMTSGLAAVSATIAIVLGIVVVTGFPQRIKCLHKKMFKGKKSGKN